MTKDKTLALIDFQNDFVAPKGALTLDNGQGDIELIKRMRIFVDRLPKDYFDNAVITYDTHDLNTYHLTEEAKSFPIHCVPNTKGWHLAVNPLQIIEKVKNPQILKKDTYDMWAGTKAQDDIYTPGVAKLYPKDIKETAEQLQGKQFGTMEEINEKAANSKNVYLIGVASDICNRAAMEGWLKRGAKVTIISDLTRGIMKETNEVLAEKQYEPFIKSGQLRSITMNEFFKEVYQQQITPNIMNFGPRGGRQ